MFDSLRGAEIERKMASMLSADRFMEQLNHNKNDRKQTEGAFTFVVGIVVNNSVLP